MIFLTFYVDNISTVIQVYDQILIERGAAEGGPFTTVSGLGPVSLVAGTTIYSEVDSTGTSTDWYRSRYYSSSTGSYSGYSDPVLGETGDLYYNPLFPSEVSYGTSDQDIISRIRTYIGDPKRIRREYGPETESSIHPDGVTYELDEKGWPASVYMGGEQHTSTGDPIVHGYRYLKFNTTISGYNEDCEDPNLDVWYYTFRLSDREIYETYELCPIPAGLTSDTVTTEAYILQTSINLVVREFFEDAIEDGAVVVDERTRYDPSPGLAARRALKENLERKLDALIKSLMMVRIEGVLID
jgi:hypothetical protein